MIARTSRPSRRRSARLIRLRNRRVFRRNPRVVSLFSGYGGLDLGVQSVIGGDVIAHAEFDDAPSRILDHHWPDVPNFGDVTAVDWAAFIAAHPEVGYLEHGYRPGLVITGGFPCQDVSLAGLRRGLRDGTRSGLWTEFARAIDKLRPELVVIENVRGLLSAEADREMESSPWGVGDRHDGPALRALGAVLGDLAELGYDAQWCGLRAADAGAPHGRFRVFVVARPANADRDGLGSLRRLLTEGCDADRRGRTDGARHEGEPTTPSADTAGCGRDRRAQDEVGCAVGRASVAWGGGAVGSAADPSGRDERRGAAGDLARTARAGEGEGDQRERHGNASADRAPAAREWGPYASAVERWERVTGRVAPAPTNPDGRGGTHRLAPEFVEWMMGLAAGHVTDAPITRAQMLKALGNGVVPQQAALALRVLLERAGWTEWVLAA